MFGGSEHKSRQSKSPVKTFLACQYVSIKNYP
jgi:regulator of PEP synthase PpsR (kinase-PPPase family)